MQERQIVDYQVCVEGAEENGHPVGNLSLNFPDACRSMDMFKEKFPHHTIRLFATEKKEIAKYVGKPKPLPISCPNGHGGFVDGKTVIRQGSTGLLLCSVCGSTC